ncbi:hypothetical protein [Saliphagus sp. LR7]|uniref:hypothetical protein n=1 Tax=Saliphagus sp. LR7 TaxID=2282654 RepID=UPI0013008BF8|nr:hypothetical protein [Saliphagus sp. LR7]
MRGHPDRSYPVIHLLIACFVALTTPVVYIEVDNQQECRFLKLEFDVVESEFDMEDMWFTIRTGTEADLTTSIMLPVGLQRVPESLDGASRN